MRPVAVVAAQGMSGLGVGASAWRIGEVGKSAKSAIEKDPLLVEAGLKKPFASRIPIRSTAEPDRARLLLERTARDLAVELDRVAPGWRSRRVVAFIGTSSGGMPSQERFFAERDKHAPIERGLARAAPYFGPLAGISEILGSTPSAVFQVLAACASSTYAIGLGCRELELGGADLVIAGGYDALSVFVAAGFEALGATSASLPAPFRTARDGMALGEGSALIALALDAPTEPLGWVLGFAASSDAVHATAPDRAGSGLAAAATAALADAQIVPECVNIVSAHGTATPFNDAAESKAIRSALGASAECVVIHPFKAVIGHTLGAAGVLESLAAFDALGRGVLPAAIGSGPIEPELHGRLLEENVVGKSRCCLKLSAAFGGANAALVLGRTTGDGAARPRRSVRLLALGEPQLTLDVDTVARLSGADRSKLVRVDPLSALALAATASAVERLGRPLAPGAGVVVGTVAATVEINDQYDARRRTRGARFVEPRRFPPTSPNLAPGEVSITFGLHGPSLSIGASTAAATEALLVAARLVEANDCSEIVVIAVDQVGAAVTDLFAAAELSLPKHGALAVVLGAEGGRPLERDALRITHERACAADGRVAGQPPGWASLAAALRTD